MAFAHLLASSEPASDMTAGEHAIVRTVLYAAVFDYPLTLAQLRHGLIESSQTPTEILKTCTWSPHVLAAVEQRDGLFFPAGRSHLVEERRAREHRSRAFLERHRAVISIICALPYVRMVALSGSIAHMNLEADGDLDLFIVTKGSRVWSVTVAVIVLAKLMRRRKTVCANFVVADRTLALEQQDLFAASQVVHLKPLTGHTVFARFLDANPFVSLYYPNFRAPRGRGGHERQGGAVRGMKSILEAVLLAPSALAERICRLAYRSYLLRRAPSWRSPEHVRLDADCLKLHTGSHRHSVLARFEQTAGRVEEVTDRP